MTHEEITATQMRCRNVHDTAVEVTEYTPSDDDLLIIKAVATTLFMVADWGSHKTEMLDVAHRVADRDIADWTFCPVCEEVACDGDCPLYAVRLHAGLWT